MPMMGQGLEKASAQSGAGERVRIVAETLSGVLSMLEEILGRLRPSQPTPVQPRGLTASNVRTLWSSLGDLEAATQSVEQQVGEVSRLL